MPLANLSLKRPKKEDTLAEKAEKRSRRLVLKNRLIEILPQWWIGTGEILGLALLAGLNFFLLFPFFGQEHQFNGFSAPLIPVLSSFIPFLVPYPYALRFWLTVLLILFPLSFYFFIREVSRRRLTAFSAAFIVSLPVSIFLPRRVNLGLLSEDGGYVASLALVALACLFLLRFLRGGGFKIAIAASLGITSVALTSPLGLFVLLCFSLALAFSEMLLSQARTKLLRFLAVIALAAGFSAFWYNPKFDFLIITSPQGELIRKTLLSLLPLSFFLVPLLAVFGFLLFENRPRFQPLFLAVFLTIGFGLFSLGAGMQLSTPSRFLPVLGISVSFLLGIIVSHFFDYFQTSKKLRKFGIINRFRRLIILMLAVFFLGLLLFVISIFRENLVGIQEVQILELDEVKKAGLWEVRREIGMAANIFGVLISLFTIVLTFYLWREFPSLENKPLERKEQR